MPVSPEPLVGAYPQDVGANEPDRALRLGLLMLAYFGVQLILRLWSSDALERDESEQVLWTQQLALGYGAQPPLYTWLQWGVFQVFGVSVFSLALLKNVLLALTYTFTYKAARTVLPQRVSAVAAASMLLLPQIGWESQRDLTHSVICTTAAAATLWLVLELVRSPKGWLYPALGVATAAGMLGKYSYAAYALALLGALAVTPDTRSRVMTWRTAGAVAVAAVLVAPHALWLAAHWREATQGTIVKMDVATPALSWADGVARGLWSLVVGVAAFLTPWWIVMAVALTRRAPDAARDHAELPATPGCSACGLLRRYLLLIALLFVGLVIAGGVTHFKDRWMQPYLFMVPVIAFACWPRMLASARLHLLQRTVIVVACLLPVLLALRVPFNGWRDKPDELNLPAAALQRAVREAGFTGGVVVADRATLGAALRLGFPSARVEVARNESPPRAQVRAQPALWIATGDDPSTLQRMAAAQGVELEVPQVLRLPYTHARPGARPMAWVFSLQRGSAGP